MIHLLFVGDGPRDDASVPRLVQTILGAEIQAETTHWMRARKGGHGYRRKLLYHMRLVKDRGAAGLVATLDADKDRNRNRLREMSDAREGPQAPVPKVPTALGEATPHGEAWLLDDPKAVREGLSLPGDAAIPNVADTKDPKKTLKQLYDQSPRCDEPHLDVLADIAKHVELKRCNHAQQTGFGDFVEEVLRELGPLVQQQYTQ